LLGQWDQADQHFRTALRLRPHFPKAHNNLAMLLARRGRVDEAFQEFARSGASELEARCNLALAFMMEGHVDAAQQQIALVGHLAPASDVPSLSALKRTIQTAAASSTEHRLARIPPPDGESISGVPAQTSTR
jgi:Tfp pilus assembly protein PilF